jgi:hypothetical protein
MFRLFDEMPSDTFKGVCLFAHSLPAGDRVVVSDLTVADPTNPRVRGRAVVREDTVREMAALVDMVPVDLLVDERARCAELAARVAELEEQVGELEAAHAALLRLADRAKAAAAPSEPAGGPLPTEPVKKAAAKRPAKRA